MGGPQWGQRRCVGARARQGAPLEGEFETAVVGAALGRPAMGATSLRWGTGAPRRAPASRAARCSLCAVAACNCASCVCAASAASLAAARRWLRLWTLQRQRRAGRELPGFQCQLHRELRVWGPPAVGPSVRPRRLSSQFAYHQPLPCVGDDERGPSRRTEKGPSKTDFLIRCAAPTAAARCSRSGASCSGESRRSGEFPTGSHHVLQHSSRFDERPRSDAVDGRLLLGQRLAEACRPVDGPRPCERRHECEKQHAMSVRWRAVRRRRGHRRRPAGARGVGRSPGSG